MSIRAREDDSPTWTKHAYGAPGSGSWTITNGTLRFDIHQQIDGSYRGNKPPNYFVTPEESTRYAYEIVEALNNLEVGI